MWKQINVTNDLCDFRPLEEVAEKECSKHSGPQHRRLPSRRSAPSLQEF